MYRRDALLQVGGYDPRFTSYEQADLHLRLTRQMPGGTVIAQRAVVHHRHRSRWRDYARQQLSYGSGYAQFYVRYGDELRWTAAEEARAWLALLPLALRALMPGRADAVIRRRGEFVKRGAQRIGFARTFWSRAEAARWQEPAPASTEADA